MEFAVFLEYLSNFVYFIDYWWFMSFTPPPFGHPLSEGEPTGVMFRVASRFPL